MRKPPLTWMLGASALCVALLLQGCGGGGATAQGGTPTGANTTAAVANGVVTGFGSVFVDGKEIEDATALVQTENADGSYSNTVLQMGQRVRVAHDGKGTASKVTVDAAVLGKVSGVDATAGTLTVAGQAVKVNADSAMGPITVWAGGYTDISSVAVADLVEVHGSPVYDSATQRYTVTASRIQKIDSNTAGIVVNGRISNLNTTGKTFMLNGLTVNYTSAVLRPSSATLSDGSWVTAYGLQADLTGATLTAKYLKVNSRNTSTDTTSTTQLGGVVSNYDATAQTFEVQGIKIAVTAGTSINPTGATLANQAYVLVTGTVGADGSVTATNIQVRGQNTSTDLAKVQLIGVISDWVDATSFVVRGVPVDASNIVLSEACPGVTVGNGTEVQVQAVQQADTPVVLATKLQCKAQAAVVIRPVDGTVSSVDSSAKSFVLTVANSTTSQTVLWNTTTTFVGVTAATLVNTSVRVEGYLSNNQLIARIVRATATTGGTGSTGAKLDDDDFRRPVGSTGSSNDAWSKYRNRKGHR